MKLTLLLSPLIVFCSFLPTQKKPIIKGKLVYRSCATLVIQVIDAKHFAITQNSWQPENSGKKYKNVFAVSNQCSFPDSIEVGQQVNFQIIPNDPNTKDCMLCSLFDNPPKKSHLVKVVRSGK